MNLFIIGSGFTKAVFPNAPVNSELMDHLASAGQAPAASRLRDQYNTKDIEIALTRLDMDIADMKANPSGNCVLPTMSLNELTELRKESELELANFFCFTSELSERPTCKFTPTENLAATPWLKAFLECIRSGDILVSLNYDCVLEGLLDLQGKWTPNGGYGIPLVEDGHEVSKTTVLKIHGSASFGGKEVVGDPASSSVEVMVRPWFFPRSGANKFLTQGAWCAIIAPSFVKTPARKLASIMLEALDAARCADNCVIIGCALRPEDSFLTLLHTSFYKHNRNGKIIVVDPDASEIKARLLGYWGIEYGDRIHSIENLLQKGVTELAELMNG